MSLRFVLRSDVHISDHTPQSRLDNWAETVSGKLVQVGEIAREVGADAVLDNGDFFDVKSPGRNSHNLVRRIAEIHAEYPCPVWANVGNHDCVYGSIEFLDQQPLGVLFATGVFNRCYGAHEAIFQKEGVCVRVVGIPYHGPRYDLEKLKIEKRDEDYLVVMAHVLASPQGGSMFEGEDIVKYDQLLELAPDVSVWAFGHWHKDQGIQEIGAGVSVVNIGSLTRGALSQDNVDRTPAVAVLTFTKDHFETATVDLKVEPAKDVFNLERRVQAEARSMTMEAFVSSLRETLGKETETESLEDKIKGMDVPHEVRERTILYLERAEDDG